MLAQKQIDIFHALADPTRRRILTILASRPLAAGEIARRFPQCRPAISKHLTILKRAGLLQERREAQRRLYSVRTDAVIPVATFLDGLQPRAKSGTSPAKSKPAASDPAERPPTTRGSGGFELEFD